MNKCKTLGLIMVVVSCGKKMNLVSAIEKMPSTCSEADMRVMGYTPLMMAAEKGDTEGFKKAMDMMARCNRRTIEWEKFDL